MCLQEYITTSTWIRKMVKFYCTKNVLKYDRLSFHLFQWLLKMAMSSMLGLKIWVTAIYSI